MMPTPLHYIFFVFGFDLGAYKRVTPPGQGCRFLYRVHFVLIFYFFFNVKFEMQDRVQGDADTGYII